MSSGLVGDFSEEAVEVTGVGVGLGRNAHLHNFAVVRSPECRVCTSAWFLRTGRCAFVWMRRSRARC